MMWIPFMIVLALFAMYFKRNLFGTGPSYGRDDQPHKARDPLEILKERYARGEIGKDEYEEKKKDLER
jgi:putative membrane protein